jgi:hypothetical protein
MFLFNSYIIRFINKTYEKGHFYAWVGVPDEKPFKAKLIFTITLKKSM